MKNKTTLITGGALSVPVFDASYTVKKKREPQNVGRYLEPEVLRNSILQKMFSPEELESLTVVKIDKDNPKASDLRPRKFEDGIKRSLIFSSGSSYYFGDDELKAKIQKIFETSPDSACRYGSLLVSNCMSGCKSIKLSNRPLNIKIVDFKDGEYAEFKTGDCHGKISPRLAQAIGGESNRALQFRLAWLTDWNKEDNPNAPETSFIAKGTLLPDAELTKDLGYDLILDRSSIKGINKKLLDEYIPCGDYELPKTVLGNRENSGVRDYKNSWQLFGIWCSEEAQRLDLVPETKKQAEKLASLQRDPLKLAKYIVEDYDKKQAFIAQQNESEGKDCEDSSEDSDKKKEEMGMIKILRNDKRGLMISHPAVVDFLKNLVANKWKELAINSGVKLGSGMTLPCPDLPRGTICAGHLPDGEEIVLTRYPVLNKDNIRKYTNEHRPSLTKYLGVIWVNPEDFEEFHQGDFDGDKAVVKRAKEIPNIAKEIRKAGEKAKYDYIPVIQAAKVPYTEVKDENGKKKYDTLEKIAVASSQQKVGIVATYIGRVASAVPTEGENEKLFNKKQRNLIIGLSIMEQYEVDYQKNALRGEDALEIKEHTGINASELIARAKKFCESHPSLLFDYKKDERLYRTFPLPADGENPINVLAREAVNPYWEETQIKARERHEFRDILPEIEEIEWKENELEWAKEINEQAKEGIKEISFRTGNDRKAFKEEIGKLYEALRAEINDIYSTPEEKMPAATALYRVTHTPPNTKHRTRCQEIAAEQLEVAFSISPDYELLHEAAPRDAYVLQVPFSKIEVDTELVVSARYEEALNNKGYKEGIHYEKDKNKLIFKDEEKWRQKFDKAGLPYDEKEIEIDLPNYWKDELESLGIKYEAVAHESLPLVEFAFKIKPEDDCPESINKFIQELQSEYGNNENIIDPDELTLYNPKTKKDDKLVIMPPANCSWIEKREEMGKGKLAFNLFPEQLASALENFQIEEIDVIGVTHPNNDFTNENFSSKNWRGKKITFEVGAISLPEDHPDYIRYQGSPILQIDGQNLGTFAASSPKLPIGTNFEAVINAEPLTPSKLTLKVAPDSIRVASASLDIEETVTLRAPQSETLQEFAPEEIAERLLTYSEICSPQEIAFQPNCYWDYMGKGNELVIKVTDESTEISIVPRASADPNKGLIEPTPIFSARLDKEGKIKIKADRLTDDDKELIQALPQTKTEFENRKKDEDLANLLDEFTEKHGSYTSKRYNISVSISPKKQVVVREKSQAESELPKFKAIFTENETDVRISSFTDSERDTLKLGLENVIREDRLKEKRTIPTTVRLGNKEIEESDTRRASQSSKNYQDKLISKIAQAYNSIEEPNPSLEKINLGIAGWTAYVKSSGRCIVRTGDNETIFKANINTGKITQNLREEHLELLIENPQLKKPAIKNSPPLDVRPNKSEALLSIISEHYNQLTNPSPDFDKISLSAGWTAYVKQDGRCIVKTSDNETIYKANIMTGKVTQGLSEEYLDKPELREPTEETKLRAFVSDDKALLSAINKHYKTLTNPKEDFEQINLGIAGWTAYVKPDGRCIVKTSDNETIYKANIETGKITQGLDEEHLVQLREEVKEREQQLREDNELTLTKTQKKSIEQI